MFVSSRNAGSATLQQLPVPIERARAHSEALHGLQIGAGAINPGKVDPLRLSLDRLEHIFALVLANPHLGAGLDAERLWQAHGDRIAGLECLGCLHGPTPYIHPVYTIW